MISKEIYPNLNLLLFDFDSDIIFLLYNNNMIKVFMLTIGTRACFEIKYPRLYKH